MELVAFGNGIVQIAVIWVAWNYIRNKRARDTIAMIAAVAACSSLLGLLWVALGDAGMLAVGAWVVYAAIGVAVVVAVVVGLRGGRTRFAWPQGRYQRYRTYRRI